MFNRDSWVKVTPPIADFGEVDSDTVNELKLTVQNIRPEAIKAGHVLKTYSESVVYLISGLTPRKINFQHAYSTFNLIYDEEAPRTTLPSGLSSVFVNYSFNL